MRRLLTTAVLAALTLSSGAVCGVVYVSASGSDSYDGSSWTSAKKTIGAGVDAASAGDQVWVASGYYVGRIKLKDGVALYGGFPAAGGSWETRDRSRNLTQIDGGQSGSAVTAPYGAGPDTIIDGFVIRNGRSDTGGGVYCYNASPTISNNVITLNTASGYNGYGGGVCCEHSSPLITADTIQSNSAASGAGVYCASDSHPVISGNSFVRNTGVKGGAIYVADYSSPTISANTISGTGSGIYCEWNASPTIQNNDITGNNAPKGGGIYCDNSPVVLLNNTIADNSAPGSGGGIASIDSPSTVSNNIVAFNSSGMFACTSDSIPSVLRSNCVFGNTDYGYDGLQAGSGDISMDPGFVDRAASDYHLSAQSLCINRGSNSVAGLPVTDIDGEGRVWGGVVDIGADEFRSAGLSPSDVKELPDETWVGVAGSVVSASFRDYFYIQGDDRTSGIRVFIPGQTFQEGTRLEVSGIVRTNSDGERYIGSVTTSAAQSSERLSE